MLSRPCAIVVAVFVLLSGAGSGAAVSSVLFIGNSFTFAAGSAVRFYRADTVTDLNGQGQGGIPALFRSFANQVGLDYDVSLETHPGSHLDFHLANRRDVISRRQWDVVVMHGHSTLDVDAPGNPAKLLATSAQMATLLRGLNPRVQIYLLSTWSRADQTYVPKGAWAGQPIEAMARDVRAAYDQAAARISAKGVLPSGRRGRGRCRPASPIRIPTTASRPASSICGRGITTTPASRARTWKRWSCSAASPAAIRARSATPSARRSSWG